MTGETKTDENIIVKALFENIINSLKNNEIKKIGNLPRYAISEYYNRDSKHFDLLAANFIEKYVANESLVEGVHENVEKEGLKEVYKYIFSNYLDANIDITYLMKLHEILYSKVPFPEAGGRFRLEPSRLEGAVVSLCDWEEIPNEIYKTNKWLNKIIKQSENVQTRNNIDILFNYIEECIRFKCHLIQIHPFSDGNGRTIRALTNKLFILAGIPPVYVHAKEKEIYKKAMEKAINEKDFSEISQFYYIKICQSIYELSINPNRDLKRKNDFKKIKRIVENYKFDINEDFSIEDLSFHYAENIKRELEEEKITSEIYTVQNTNEEYAYLMATLKDKNKKQNILIDPLFSHYIIKNNIKINLNIPFEDRLFLTYLFTDGVAKTSTSKFELYLQTLGILSKTKEKQKTLKKNN